MEFFLFIETQFPGPVQQNKKLVECIQDKMSKTDSVNEILLWSVLELYIKHDPGTGGGDLSRNTELRKSVIELFRSSEGEWLSDKPRTKILKQEEEEITQKEAEERGREWEEEILQEIQEKMDKGQKEEALKQAIENKLWTHALIIGNILNKFSEVVTRYTSEAMNGECTLTSLYHLFTGGSQFHSNSIDISNKWKSQVALILENNLTNQKSLISKIGDYLFNLAESNEDLLFSSHVCFILASVPFQLISPSSHLVLLGANHRKSNFLNVKSLLLSEIYEFICIKYYKVPPPPSFQKYKLLLASLFADLGKLNVAKSYADSIQSAIKYFLLSLLLLSSLYSSYPPLLSLLALFPSFFISSFQLLFLSPFPFSF